LIRSKTTEFPGLRHVIVLIPWMVVGLSARAPIRDNSFLWHVRAGALQGASGSVLTSDPFSFNAPATLWRTQSWLADLAYSWLEQASGLGFVWPMILGIGTLLVVTLGVLFRSATRSLFWLAVLLTASSILISPYLSPRPALFSLLLFALVIISSTKRALWWALPLLCWIWAGIHGAWPLGILFVLLKAIVDRDWRLGLQVAPMSVVTLFTAHGWGVFDILVDFLVAREWLAFITEWAPTNFSGLPGFLLIVGLLTAILWHTSRRDAQRHVWLVLPFLYLATSSTRSLPFAWLASTPLLVGAIAGRIDPQLLRREIPGRRPINAVIVIALIAIPFVLAPAAGLDQTRFPIDAVTHLNGARLFHDDVTGGYLIYLLGPERQVFIDDRAELYGSRIREFIEVRNADPNWRALFERLDIGQALIRGTDPIAQVLEQSGWIETYGDLEFRVLVSPES